MKKATEKPDLGEAMRVASENSQRTYLLSVICRNCGARASIRVRFGAPFTGKQHACQNCGCYHLVQD